MLEAFKLFPLHLKGAKELFPTTIFAISRLEYFNITTVNKREQPPILLFLTFYFFPIREALRSAAESRFSGRGVVPRSAAETPASCFA
jgi:hypothetical protein